MNKEAYELGSFLLKLFYKVEELEKEVIKLKNENKAEELFEEINKRISIHDGYISKQEK